MTTTRTCFSSISMVYTPVAFFVSLICLPFFPTTSPISSLSIGKSRRQPEPSFSCSEDILDASSSRVLRAASRVSMCLPCKSSRIFAIWRAFSVPNILICGVFGSTASVSTRAFAHVSCSAACPSGCRNQSCILGSLKGNNCLTNNGLVRCCCAPRAGRIRSFSTISSLPLPQNCTTWKAPLIDFTSASYQALPSSVHKTSTTESCLTVKSVASDSSLMSSQRTQRFVFSSLPSCTWYFSPSISMSLAGM
mmetsp:Transcript_70209/g.116656  ORF Transcript_70209/g.116656 Transcript_70209/m.116656 type:complete len:250 (-) Transcript_70209:190-939(-)